MVEVCHMCILPLLSISRWYSRSTSCVSEKFQIRFHEAIIDFTHLGHSRNIPLSYDGASNYVAACIHKGPWSYYIYFARFCRQNIIDIILFIHCLPFRNAPCSLPIILCHLLYLFNHNLYIDFSSYISTVLTFISTTIPLVNGLLLAFMQSSSTFPSSHAKPLIFCMHLLSLLHALTSHL